MDLCSPDHLLNIFEALEDTKTDSVISQGERSYEPFQGHRFPEARGSACGFRMSVLLSVHDDIIIKAKGDRVM